jgi:surface protein
MDFLPILRRSHTIVGSNEETEYPPAIPFIVRVNIGTKKTFLWPTRPSEVDCTIDWGDGTVDHIVGYDITNWTHTYANSGIYTISILGKCGAPRFFDPDWEQTIEIVPVLDPNWDYWRDLHGNPGSKEIAPFGIPEENFDWTWYNLYQNYSAVIEIVQWGYLQGATDWSHAFAWGEELLISATDPFGKLVLDTSFMFYGGYFSNTSAFALNWEMGTVKNMAGMWWESWDYQYPIGYGPWDMSSCEDISFFATYRWEAPDKENSWSEADDPKNWNTSNIKRMSNVFNWSGDNGDNTQPLLDLSGWDVSNVEYFDSMFYGSANIDFRTLENWNFASAISLRGMFAFSEWHRYPRPNLNRWRFPKARSLEYMFNDCYDFDAYITDWDISNVESLAGMFRSAEIFNQFIGNWNTSKVKDLTATFRGCNKFNQPLALWDVSNVIYMYATFEGCQSFNQTLKQWDVSSVISMKELFEYCFELNQEVFSSTGNVTDMSYMFRDCRKLNIPLNLDTSSCVSMRGMFQNAYRFNQPINFDTSNVTDFSYMFSNACINVQDIDLELGAPIGTGRKGYRGFGQTLNHLDFSKATTLASMFNNHRYYNLPINFNTTDALKDLNYMFFNARGFNSTVNFNNTSKVTNFSDMFDGATEFNQPLNHLDVSSGINFSRMFALTPNVFWNTKQAYYNSRFFTPPDPLPEDWLLPYTTYGFNQPLNNWDTSKATNFYYMFFNATNFNQNINNWNIQNVTSLFGTFNQADSFNQPLNNWNTSKVTTCRSMFGSADLFNQPIGNWDVSKCTDFRGAFSYAVVFNQNLSCWNVQHITTAPADFNYSGIISPGNLPKWGQPPNTGC